jgi:D-alanyl-lipoteichoic acid acyltransferase DltB (MBOAT superfamily)
MTFTTLTFLIFLAVFFPLYWGLRNRTAQNVLIVVASYIFYGWWDWRFCGLMLAASLLDYGVGLGLNRVEAPGRRKALLAFGLCGNLGMLGYFKYFNFFAENFRTLMGTFGWEVHPATLQVVLPVGISFYTFQTMSYSIDVYRGRLRATTRIIEYLAYVSFFPQLVAGPIERATNLLPQFFQERVFNHDQTVAGCRQMLWGFFKKMVIADNLAPVADQMFDNPAGFTGGELVVATVCFAFQIYCDFSAYSDIAIGLARLFGFELTRNFAFPNFSQSPGEFWRRWHISLTSWFKDYVYIPLGGSRVSPGRRVFNVLITFLLSGLWHGASWNFLAWGALNGIGVLPETLSRKRKTLRGEDVPGGMQLVPSFKTLSRMLLTFAFVCFGWIFFRAHTLGDAWLILRRIAAGALHLDEYFLGFMRIADEPAGPIVFIALAVLVLAEWAQRRHTHPFAYAVWPRPVRWAAYLGVSTAILIWGTSGTNQFIYFQF